MCMRGPPFWGQGPPRLAVRHTRGLTNRSWVSEPRAFLDRVGIGSSQLIEEERRLLYVAMTRARQHLHILVPQRFYVSQQRTSGDRHVYASLSRFITPSIANAFEWVGPTQSETRTGSASTRTDSCPHEQEAVRCNISQASCIPPRKPAQRDPRCAWTSSQHSVDACRTGNKNASCHCQRTVNPGSLRRSASHLAIAVWS